MTAKTRRAPSINTEKAKHIGIIEFQDERGDWHDFEIMETRRCLVFGGACNLGFLQSGFIVREDHETLEATLQELLCDLQVYYDNGPGYVARIMCNERM